MAALPFQFVPNHFSGSSLFAMPSWIVLGDALLHPSFAADQQRHSWFFIPAILTRSP